MLEQILFDILLILPVMSLLRFRSVCKSWFYLIESSTFITQHLTYNSDKEDNLIIFNRHWDIDLKRYDMHLFLHSGSQYVDRVYIDLNRLLWHPVNEEILLAGSCNGIVCLEHRKSLDVALWNPALNQLRPLPRPLISLTSVEHTAYSYSYRAFGIDVKTNDYKVLKIFILLSKEFEVVGNQVEVYSLRDNSWRIIRKSNIMPFLSSDYIDVVSPCLNGKCFWIRHGKLSSSLISFDFADEVFGTMSLPDGKHDPCDPCRLDIYNDKIIYIRLRDDYNNIPPSGFKLEIWMLCEYGIKESWNKIYTTEPLFPLDRKISPVGLSKNGEFLICKNLDEGFRQKLYLYNLRTKEGIFNQCKPLQVIHYNASLVSVKSGQMVFD